MSNSPIQARRLQALTENINHVNENSAYTNLTQEQINSYYQNGFVILRNAFTPEEVKNMYDPIIKAYEEHDYEASPAYDRPKHIGYGPRITGAQPDKYLYPKPGNFPMSSRMMDRDPTIVPRSCEHPLVVNSCETLLNDRAILSQYQIYCRTPGANGTGKASEETQGFGSHYDYKPWRPVGSFLNWMFAIIPLVDYSKEVGPLLLSPGSHLKSRILDTHDDRIHLVETGCLPEASAINLVDGELKAGDLCLMNGFTWHEAWPNRSNITRIGLYLKFHGEHSPPATGPLIHPKTALKHANRYSHIFANNFRDDNKFSAIVDFHDGGCAPSNVIDRVSIVLENANDQKILCVKGKHLLPEIDANETRQYTNRQRNALQYLDAGNVIDTILMHLVEEIEVEMPYVSWICDEKKKDAFGNIILNRIYAYRITTEEEHVINENLSKDNSKYEWIDTNDLKNEYVKKVSYMWINSVNEKNEKVLRSAGFSHPKHNKMLATTYNGPGNPIDKYVCGIRLGVNKGIQPPPIKMKRQGKSKL